MSAQEARQPGELVGRACVRPERPTLTVPTGSTLERPRCYRVEPTRSAFGSAAGSQAERVEISAVRRRVTNTMD